MALVRFATISKFLGHRFGDDGSVWTELRSGPAGRSSKLTGVWKKRKPSKTNGYLYVCMMESGRQVNYWVHRLVLEAFVSPCPEKMECRHLDGDRLNNCLSNLKWGTKEENMMDRKMHGKNMNGPIGEKHGHAKLTNFDVLDILEAQKNGITQRSIARKYGIDQSTVSGIVRGKRWSRAIAQMKGKVCHS